MDFPHLVSHVLVSSDFKIPRAFKLYMLRGLGRAMIVQGKEEFITSVVRINQKLSQEANLTTEG